MTVAVDVTPGGAAKSIENDITDISWGVPRGEQDTTGLDKSGMERLLLLADFTFTATGVFNDATDASWEVGKTVGSTTGDRTVTIVISGQTLVNEVVLTDFSFVRAADGSFTWTMPGSLSNGTVPVWS